MNSDQPSKIVTRITLFAALLLGVMSGYGAKVVFSGTPSTSTANNLIKPDGTIGSGGDASAVYKDSAEGLLKEGGIDGEGSFNLERPGGVSQTVYLTSSTVDLSEYLGKKIKVYGQTMQAQKAGWLMDVGKVEVVQ